MHKNTFNTKNLEKKCFSECLNKEYAFTEVIIRHNKTIKKQLSNFGMRTLCPLIEVIRYLGRLELMVLSS